MMYLKLLLLFFVIIFGNSFAAKILGFTMAPIRSHFIVHNSLLKELAAKGHDVTMVSLYSLKDFPDMAVYNRLIEVSLTKEAYDYLEKMRKDMLDKANKENVSVLDTFLKMPSFIKVLNNITAIAINNLDLERLKKEQFDLVIFGWILNDFQIGLAGYFRCPSVILTSTPATSALRNLIGNPAPFTYQPSIIQPNAKLTTFAQRLQNLALSYMESLFDTYVHYFITEPFYEQNFPASKNYPSYDEVKKNISLVLVSQHFSQTGPQLSFPGLIEISGIHIKNKPDPLPQNYQDFLDGAKDGAILFSLGSSTKSSHLPSEKVKALLNIFSKLKQRVLWKWEDDSLPGKPDNVMIGKWLPQDDVLAHPNIRLFVSHCGKGSLYEAKFHSVPILALPIFADQMENANLVEKEGWAIQTSLAELEEDTFLTYIKELLENPKYRNVVKSAADLYRDRPMEPLDTAVYWVEYVIRHNGAKHMQSQAVHLNFFQYYGLDIYAAIALVLYVIWKLTTFLFCFILCKMFKSKAKKKLE